jgi:hypothetical protein
MCLIDGLPMQILEQRGAASVKLTLEPRKPGLKISDVGRFEHKDLPS